MNHYFPMNGDQLAGTSTCFSRFRSCRLLGRISPTLVYHNITVEPAYSLRYTRFLSEEEDGIMTEPDIDEIVAESNDRFSHCGNE